MTKSIILLCAWILWAHSIAQTPAQKFLRSDNPSLAYEVVQAYDSRVDCEKVQKTTRLPKGYDRLVCLPDTVKPQ